MTRMGPTAGRGGGLLVTLAACGGSSGRTTATDVGITSNSILLGNTIAQSGPAAAYGTIANAENAYFTYINNQGGVNGRKIKFKILDDGYNPAQTVPLTKQLVEQDQVFAMFSGLGTQTQTSVRDYLNAKKVPQLFVATGATTFIPGLQLAPVDARLAAALPGRGAHLRQGRPRQPPQRQDRRALPERRLRPGLSEGPDRRPRLQALR